MWDGTVVFANAQWENADPDDFGKPGSFDVRGYLLGSRIQIVAHVRAMGLKNDVVAECGYYPGAPETIHADTALELENGDTAYVQSIVWDAFPDDLRRGVPGTYEVGAQLPRRPFELGPSLQPVV